MAFPEIKKPKKYRLKTRITNHHPGVLSPGPPLKIVLPKVKYFWVLPRRVPPPVVVIRDSGLKLLILAFFIVGGLVFWQKVIITGQHAQAQTSLKPQVPFKVSPAWPKDAAAAALGVEGYGVVASTGDKQKRPIASIAKVITALALLEKHPLKPGEAGPTIPITEQDEQLYRDYVAKNGTVVLIKAGIPISLRDAVEAMLLPSSNNIADTAALWAFGSLAQYQKYANDMLKRYGLYETEVGTDASGLDPSTKSTASDLILLGERAMKHPIIAEIANLPSATIPFAGSIPNYNSMVTKHGFNGIKPGESIEAGNTLLFSAPYALQGRRVNLIGVILGTENYKASNNGALELTTSLKKNIDDAGMK